MKPIGEWTFTDSRGREWTEMKVSVVTLRGYNMAAWEYDDGEFTHGCTLCSHGVTLSQDSDLTPTDRAAFLRRAAEILEMSE